jgi:CHRD domain
MNMLGKCSKLLAATSIAGALLASVPAQAATIVYVAQLTGASEIPAVTSNGFGSAAFYLDDIARTLRIQVNFSGLTGNLTVAHIHCCVAQPANAGVATTTPTFAGFPAGGTSGYYDSVLDLNLTTSYSSAFLTANGGTPSTAYAALVSGMNGQRS